MRSIAQVVRRLGQLLAVLIMSVTVVWAALVVPRWLYPPLTETELQGVTGKDRIQLINERLKLQNDARAGSLQGLAGLAVLVGAWVGWRQLQLNRLQVRESLSLTRLQIEQAQVELATAREQLAVSEEGQITERFTRAIDLLGSDLLDVRLGGIYALERIALDSVSHRPAIAQILTAYVRGHSPWPPTRPGQYVPDAPPASLPDLRTRAPDIQAALTVLGRGRFTSTGTIDVLDLHGVDLRKADLRGAHLERANLADAHLEGADLTDAHLEETNLHNALLSGASLVGAYLNRANLDDVRLDGADLTAAHLDEANLHHALLENARLVGAYLNRANLDDVRLDGADLTGAHLDEA